MKNIEKHGIFFKVALILGSVAEVAIIMIMVFCGLKWLGDLLEMLCNYVNVGVGILMICVALIGFIFLDSKNSVDECKSQKNARKRAVYHNR